jgi:hypothetical protein
MTLNKARTLVPNVFKPLFRIRGANYACRSFLTSVQVKCWYFIVQYITIFCTLPDV